MTPANEPPAGTGAAGAVEPRARLRGEPVLVTGASGFVGYAVARALAAQGARVRLLARATSPRTNLDELGAEIAVGDMRDEASVARALAGRRYLFHVAADYRLWARDPEEIVRNNLAGVRAVMGAARAAGVERIVYTSSVATLRIPDDGRPGDETGPLTPGEAIGAYKRSKVVAEREVERLVADEGLPAVIVCPSTPIGPNDVKPTPTGRILVEAAQGRMPAYVDTGLNIVHVDDVARGHLLALEKGRTGERYVLGGQDVALSRMLADIAALTGRPAPRLRLPIGPLYPLAGIAELMAKFSGKEPFLTKDSLKMASHRMYFSSAKAEAELGYTARPYGEALADALAWFRAHGHLG
jgi:dihydroflavonol-4-reductase